MIAEIMDEIYLRNLWNGDESASGPGSTKAYTGIAGAFLKTILRTEGISTMIDAGCGDHNWIGDYLPNGILYFGIDASREVIKRNVEKYANITRWFSVGDYSEDLPLPVDLIVCRHSLQHLSSQKVRNALSFFKSFSPRLIATSYDTVEDIEGTDGGFAPYNLSTQFGLGKPKYYGREPNEYTKEYNFKGEYLSYWEFE